MLHNFTILYIILQLHNTSRNSTPVAFFSIIYKRKLHKFSQKIQHFTFLYTTPHNFYKTKHFSHKTYNTLQYFTTLCNTMQHFTQLFTNFTTRFATLQQNNSSTLYNTLHNSTQLNTISPKFHKTKQTILYATIHTQLHKTTHNCKITSHSLN